MIRRCTERAALAALCLAMIAPVAARVVLTGEVRSIDGQAIFTPQSNSSPVVIRYFIPEGEPVKKGEVVLRLDPGQSAAMIPDLESQIEQLSAKGNKEIAELEVKTVEAELALLDAQAKLGTARIDARIPKGLVSDLDHDRYQGELDSATREVALQQRLLSEAREAVRRRREDNRLEIRKLEVQRDYHTVLVRNAEVRADRDGIVVHGFNNNWIGGRIDEGSSTMAGSRAGEVISTTSRFAVRAGRITAIGGAPERRPEWGNGLYFPVDIAFDPGKLPLLPGMSVRVIADAHATSAGAPR
jgi:HlyD family secretion protein